MQGALDESHLSAGCKFLATVAVISKTVNSVTCKCDMAKGHRLNLH